MYLISRFVIGKTIIAYPYVSELNGLELQDELAGFTPTPPVWATRGCRRIVFRQRAESPITMRSFSVEG